MADTLFNCKYGIGVALDAASSRPVNAVVSPSSVVVVGGYGAPSKWLPMYIHRYEHLFAACGKWPCVARLCGCYAILWPMSMIVCHCVTPPWWERNYGCAQHIYVACWYRTESFWAVWRLHLCQPHQHLALSSFQFTLLLLTTPLRARLCHRDFIATASISVARAFVSTLSPIKSCRSRAL